MGLKFNAHEILEMARQIERNGQAFYRKAAQAAEGDNRKLLLDLAAMEEQHRLIFQHMQEELPEAMKVETTFDPDDQASLYLRAFADGTVFDLQADPAAELTGAESISEVLTRAIELEKDSIAFYTGIEDMVPPKLGREKVREIIREEMSHVTLLGRRRAELAR